MRDKGFKCAKCMMCLANIVILACFVFYAIFAAVGLVATMPFFRDIIAIIYAMCAPPPAPHPIHQQCLFCSVLPPFSCQTYMPGATRLFRCCSRFWSLRVSESAPSQGEVTRLGHFNMHLRNHFLPQAGSRWPGRAL